MRSRCIFRATGLRTPGLSPFQLKFASCRASSNAVSRGRFTLPTSCWAPLYPPPQVHSVHLLPARFPLETFYQKIALSHDLCLHLSSFSNTHVTKHVTHVSNTHVSNPSPPALPPVPGPRRFVFVMAAIGASSRSQVLYESAIAIVMLCNKQFPNSKAYSISVLSPGVREARAWPCSAGPGSGPELHWGCSVGLIRMKPPLWGRPFSGNGPTSHAGSRSPLLLRHTYGPARADCGWS